MKCTTTDSHLGDGSAGQILAPNLRAACQRLGISQEGLADSAGIDRTSVSALERGRYAASMDVIERLALALNVEPASLHDRSGVPIDVEPKH